MDTLLLLFKIMLLFLDPLLQLDFVLREPVLLKDRGITPGLETVDPLVLLIYVFLLHFDLLKEVINFDLSLVFFLAKLLLHDLVLFFLLVKVLFVAFFNVPDVVDFFVLEVSDILCLEQLLLQELDLFLSPCLLIVDKLPVVVLCFDLILFIVLLHLGYKAFVLFYLLMVLLVDQPDLLFNHIFRHVRD
jgi:hypothetical protein